jgi:hypothetical protein
MPRCNTEAMTLHLAEIATQIAPGAYAVLLFFFHETLPECWMCWRRKAEARRDFHVDDAAEVAEFDPNRAMDSFCRAFRLRINGSTWRSHFSLPPIVRSPQIAHTAGARSLSCSRRAFASPERSWRVERGRRALLGSSRRRPAWWR